MHAHPEEALCYEKLIRRIKGCISYYHCLFSSSVLCFCRFAACFCHSRCFCSSCIIAVSGIFASTSVQSHRKCNGKKQRHPFFPVFHKFFPFWFAFYFLPEDQLFLLSRHHNTLSSSIRVYSCFGKHSTSSVFPCSTIFP